MFKFRPTFAAFFGNAGSKTAQLERQRDLHDDRRLDPRSPGCTGRNFVRRCFRFVFGGSNLQSTSNQPSCENLFMNDFFNIIQEDKPQHGLLDRGSITPVSRQIINSSKLPLLGGHFLGNGKKSIHLSEVPPGSSEKRFSEKQHEIGDCI